MIAFCLYWGRLNDLIRDVNQNDRNWRQIVGREQPDRRQRDAELLLRFLALWEKSQDYSKPMKNFLNDYMSERRSPEDQDLSRYRTLLTTMTRAVLECLGGRPFHVRGTALNAAVLDAVTVAIARHLDSLPEDLADRYERLKTDVEFIGATTSATTDETVVQRRIRKADAILFGGE